jgi:predicted Zn-dependent protease
VLAQGGIKFGAVGLILKSSRSDEAQADAVGAVIMYKAGYNPQAMADFFGKFASQGSSGPQFLSDHPNPGNREDAIQKKIASWPPQKYHIGGATFANAHQRAADIKTHSAKEIAQGAKTGEWAKWNKQMAFPSACPYAQSPSLRYPLTRNNSSSVLIFSASEFCRWRTKNNQVLVPHKCDIISTHTGASEALV